MGRRISGSRPSPTIIIAVLALVAALAGTAVAGPLATTSAINKKKVKKIARKQISRAAPSLSVAHADTADAANTAGNADSLDGLDSSQLQRTGLVDHAQRNGGSTTPLPLIAWPQLGVRLTTDGNGDQDAQVTLTATGKPGSTIDYATPAGTGSLGSSGSGTVGPNLDFNQFTVWDRNEATRMWAVTCTAGTEGPVNCIALRSRPD